MTEVLSDEYLAAIERDLQDFGGPAYLTSLITEVRAARARQEGWIKLTPAEIQSGHDRVRWAEGLIRQLPENHDGRNSWLLNYAAPKVTV